MVSGPVPKENRRRRNADTYADVQARVVDDGERLGPPLEGEWPERIRAWYELWRTSPQAKTFTMTDWMRLRMLAPLIEDYFKRPTATKMAEIRQNESLLGATYADRLRGRMKIIGEADEPEQPKLAAVKELKAKYAS